MARARPGLSERTKRRQRLERWLVARHALRPRFSAGPRLLTEFGLAPWPVRTPFNPPATTSAAPRPIRFIPARAPGVSIAPHAEPFDDGDIPQDAQENQSPGDGFISVTLARPDATPTDAQAESLRVEPDPPLTTSPAGPSPEPADRHMQQSGSQALPGSDRQSSTPETRFAPPELVSERAAPEADFVMTTDLTPLFVELESMPQPNLTAPAASAHAELEPQALAPQPASQVASEPIASVVPSAAQTPDAAVAEPDDTAQIVTVMPGVPETSSDRDAPEPPAPLPSAPSAVLEAAPGLMAEPVETEHVNRVEEEAQGSSLSEPASSAHPAIEMRVSRYALPPRPVDGRVPAAESARRIADDLFAPTETDRSPQSWLARLVEAARAGSQPAGAPAKPLDAGDRPPESESRPSPLRAAMSPTAPSPEPLRTETRRFLAPRVGIDPASVPIHRGTEADRVRSAFNADAVTVGQEVFLPAGFSEESPEGQGLLAHELTHVARARQPRFVPPVVTRNGPRADISPGTVDEETLATQVEASVRQQARHIDRPASHATEAAPGDPTDAIVAPVGASPTPIAPLAPSVDPFWPNQAQAVAQPPAMVPDEPDWGGLPTPWEPLPDWMMPSSPPLPETPEPAATVVDLGPTLASAPLSAAPMVQRADPGRTVASEPSAVREESREPERDEAGRNVEPDLDALARQVYAVLRRRLAAERRRTG